MRLTPASPDRLRGGTAAAGEPFRHHYRRWNQQVFDGLICCHERLRNPDR